MNSIYSNDSTIKLKEFCSISEEIEECCSSIPEEIEECCSIPTELEECCSSIPEEIEECCSSIPEEIEECCSSIPEEIEECCICLNEIIIDDYELSCCKKNIHKNCLIQWILKSDVIFKCPLCNHEIYNPQLDIINMIIKLILKELKNLNKSVFYYFKLLLFNKEKSLKFTNFNIKYRQILSKITIEIIIKNKRHIEFIFDVNEIPNEINLIDLHENLKIFNYDSCQITFIQEKNKFNLNEYFLSMVH
jgi:hypothetical protein